MTKTSRWLETIPASRQYPPLKQTIETDVVIVGGGITGILAAYHLTETEKNVVVIEKETIASGETGYTTAFLTYVVDTDLQTLHGRFGDEAAKAVWQSNKESIDEIESIIQKEHIECEWMRCPGIIYAADDKGLEHLTKESELANEFGFPISIRHSGLPWNTPGYLLVPGQAKFHPRKFLVKLVNILTERGVRFYEETPAKEFSGEHKTTVITSHGKVVANNIVISTHAPIDSLVEIPARLLSTQTYIVEGTIEKNALPEGIFWDTNDPYVYCRVDRGEDHDLLILGGEDHETGKETNTTKHFDALRAHAKILFPELPVAWAREWSGQILSTIDGIPYIGSTIAHPHHFIATGYIGNGITYGGVAGKLIADLVSAKQPVLEKVYTPKRIKGMPSLLKQGVNFIWELIGARWRGTADESEKNLAPDQGVVVRKGMRNIAIYKDAQGNVTRCSAACTHLGCTVRWNDAGKSWDCPCHGSRFAPDGKVMSGPATEPLEPEI